MMSKVCFARLNQLKESDNLHKRTLANYFLTQADSVQRMTLMQVAEETEISYATVCRFLKEIGVSGFKEFKKTIQEEIERLKKTEHNLADDSLNFTRDDSFEFIAQRIGSFAMDVTYNSYKTVTKELAEKFFVAFNRAKQIHFFGLGTSSVAAQYAYIKFFRIKNGCSFSNDIIISKMTSSLLKKNDILFLFSSSGRTKAIVDAARIAKKEGVMVVAISDFINAPLNHLADINLCTTIRDANTYLDVDFPLIQGQVTIVDILYKYLFAQKQKEALENKETTLSVIKVDKEQR